MISHRFRRLGLALSFALVAIVLVRGGSAADTSTTMAPGAAFGPLGAPNLALLNNGNGPSVADPYKSGCNAYGTSGAFSAFNPISAACNDAFGWIQAGKNTAFELMIGLLTLEFFFIGVRFALFKNDPGELIGSVAFKVLVTCIMIWVIANADGLFQSISRGFESAGQQVSQANTGSAFGLSGEYALAGLALMGVAGAAHSVDATAPIFPADQPMVGGSALVLTGTGLAAAHLHDTEYQMLVLCSYAMLACAAVIVLQYVLITAESYIVILGGIVMLGFTGSSFTMPFARGYMSYAVNNGVRMFVFYLVIGIEQKLVGGNIAHAFLAAAVPIAASAFPGGIAIADSTTIFVAISVMQIVVTTSLVWFVPNLAGSLLGGNSSLTAGTMLSTVQSSMKTAGDSLHGLASSLQRHNHSQAQPPSSGAPIATGGSSGGVASGGIEAAPFSPASNGSLGSSDLDGVKPAGAGGGGAGSGALTSNGAAPPASPGAPTTVGSMLNPGPAAPAADALTSGRPDGAPVAGPDGMQQTAPRVFAGKPLAGGSSAPVSSERSEFGPGSGLDTGSGESDSDSESKPSRGRSTSSSGQGKTTRRIAIQRVSDRAVEFLRQNPGVAATKVDLTNPGLSDQLGHLAPSTRAAMVEAIDAKIRELDENREDAGHTIEYGLRSVTSGPPPPSNLGAPSAVQIRFKIDDPSSFDPTAL